MLAQAGIAQNGLERDRSVLLRIEQAVVDRRDIVPVFEFLELLHVAGGNQRGDRFAVFGDDDAVVFPGYAADYVAELRAQIGD